MMTAYTLATAVLAVIGFLIWFARSQQRSALLALREAELRRIAKIHEEGEKIDARTEKKLDEAGGTDNDPRAMWVRDKKRLPDLSGPAAPGNKI